MVENAPKDHERDDIDIEKNDLLDKNLEEQEEKTSAKIAKLNLILLILIGCTIVLPVFITNQGGYYADSSGSITNKYATSTWFLVWFWGYMGVATAFNSFSFGGNLSSGYSTAGTVIIFPGVTILLVLAICISVAVIVIFIGSVGVINFIPEKGIAFMKSVAIFSIVTGIVENCTLIAFGNVPVSITGLLMIFLGVWML